MDKAAAAVFADPDTYATCLLALGLDRFHARPGEAGESPVHWTDATWAAEIRDLCGVDPPRRNLDRIMGACALLARPDEFYQSAAGFGDVTQALAADWFDTAVWHPPSTPECLWAAAESYLLDPPEARTPSRFSHDVRGYVTAIARRDGFPHLPPPFAAFGLPEDPDAPPFDDYAGEPDLAAAVAESLRGRLDDLDAWLRDGLTDLARRVGALPLRSGRGAAVAAEITKSLAGVVPPR